jgi:hypothetical protein
MSERITRIKELPTLDASERNFSDGLPFSWSCPIENVKIIGNNAIIMDDNGEKIILPTNIFHKHFKLQELQHKYFKSQKLQRDPSIWVSRKSLSILPMMASKVTNVHQIKSLVYFWIDGEIQAELIEGHVIMEKGGGLFKIGGVIGVLSNKDFKSFVLAESAPQCQRPPFVVGGQYGNLTQS